MSTNALSSQYLQVYGSGPPFVFNALECWVELFHIFAHWELLMNMTRDLARDLQRFAYR
jgi:hypothetical protein